MQYSLSARQLALIYGFKERFSSAPKHIFSSPGRTELCGNHTDHQGGRVLCAAITLDMLAAVSPRDDGCVCIYSEGFDKISLSLNSLMPVDAEKSTSTSLVRGVCEKLNGLGYIIGGFDAYITSNIPAGSGLSSSAAASVLFGAIQSHLYNGGLIDKFTLAKAAQYAESVHYQKPCGLMDQAAVSLGGVQLLDFYSTDNPTATAFDWQIDADYTLMLVNTGGSHQNLTEDYAAIPKEMCEVAALFNKEKLAYVDKNLFYSQINDISHKVSNRAILRAMHFFEENLRVAIIADALKQKDGKRYCEIMNQSGRSSENLLKNIVPSNSSDKSLALGLELCKQKLLGNGAYRVHGGGFAGTMQALVPNHMANDFFEYMENRFGKSSVYKLCINKTGVQKLLDI